MGCDISYHPISRAEIRHWCLDRLEEVRAGDLSIVKRMVGEINCGQVTGQGAFLFDRYLGLLQEMLEGDCKGPKEADIQNVGRRLALVQGLFRTYYYTREKALVSAFQHDPELAEYTLSLEETLIEMGYDPPRGESLGARSRGIFIPEERVPALLSDYESGKRRRALDLGFGGTVPVFLMALNHARREGAGLLEATGVVAPGPAYPGSKAALSIGEPGYWWGVLLRRRGLGDPHRKNQRRDNGEPPERGDRDDRSFQIGRMR